MPRKINRDNGDDLPRSPVASRLLAEATQTRSLVVPTPEPAPKPVIPAEKQEESPKPRKKPQSVINRKRDRVRRRNGTGQKEVRVALDVEDYDEVSKLLRDLQRSTESNVSVSHLVRAFLSLGVRSREAIKAQAGSQAAKNVPPRPANALYIELAAYEEKLADFLLVALRDRDYME